MTYATFDSTTALSSLYLWLIFGFLTRMVNCDVQRAMMSNQVVAHTAALLSFFFLFTVLDGNNDAPVWMLWAKTFSMYAIFVMWTKSRWYFSMPVLMLLIADQTIKYHMGFVQKQIDKDAADAAAAAAARQESRRHHTSQPAAPDPRQASVDRLAKVRRVLNYVIIGVVVMGFVAYGIRQAVEYRGEFSVAKLMFSIGCGGGGAGDPSAPAPAPPAGPR